MKKKELEIELQKIPFFKNPKPSYEQYVTPADIAADIIFIAYQFGDIKDKKIVDLGCGTGIFSVGAAITGAKKVFGIDVDMEAIKIAKKYAEEIDVDINYKAMDINKLNIDCDTVLMNPPFGSQKSNIRADRKFIEKAFEISDVIYSLHLSKTILFITKMINALEGNIEFSKSYDFRMRHVFNFHKKRFMDFDVTLLKTSTKK